MKHLTTYKLFESAITDISDDIRNILLDLYDEEIGYKIEHYPKGISVNIPFNGSAVIDPEINSVINRIIKYSKYTGMKYELTLKVSGSGYLSCQELTPDLYRRYRFGSIEIFISTPH